MSIKRSVFCLICIATMFVSSMSIAGQYDWNTAYQMDDTYSWEANDCGSGSCNTYKKSSDTITKQSQKTAVYKGEVQAYSPYLFYLGAYGGYGVISGAYKNDGQFTQGRLAMGFDVFPMPTFGIGGELGFQSGNTMRLDVDSNLVAITGGLEWQATLKPLVDVLIGTQIGLFAPVYIIVKAGAAYRQLQLNDRFSDSDSLKRVSPEAQAGLSFRFANHAALTMLYQGIYSTSSVGAGVNAEGDATISHIPTQQAGFIGIELCL